MYQEKRIYLLQISSHLTASSAQVLLGSRLPLCREKVLFEEGIWEQVIQGKKTYIMMLCRSKLLNDIEDILQYVVKTIDITSNLVNESDYVLTPRLISDFDYVKFEKTYTTLYLRNTPLKYAQKMIDALGDKSRYIDHKVVYNHQKNK